MYKNWLVLNLIKLKILIERSNVKIRKNCKISIKTKFHGENRIGENTTLGNVEVGYGTYIGKNSEFYNTKIGKYNSIGENVKLIVGMHPTKKYVSTHPAFYSLIKQAGFTYVNKQRFIEQKYVEQNLYLEIENDIWIGEGVKILSGIKISNGTIIGAGAVVTKDTEPYSIYVGIPAKKIGERFKEEEKNFLIKFEWWNKSEEWIRDKAELFDDISKLMEENKN